MVSFREYRKEDEARWLRCRVLAFLDTAYYDHVLKRKETYVHDAVEWVAVHGDDVIGLLDVELEAEPGLVCSDSRVRSGMIWHVAVHPDHRRKGIARTLLQRAIAIAKKKKIRRLEAWTRDDEWVMRWYEAMGFRKKDSYLQVFVENREELTRSLKSQIPHFHVVSAFVHYTGEERDWIKRRFHRVYETVQYELWLEEEGEIHTRK